MRFKEQTSTQLKFQDHGMERWTGECVELYMSHCYEAWKSKNPTSNLAVAKKSQDFVESHVFTLGIGEAWAKGPQSKYELPEKSSLEPRVSHTGSENKSSIFDSTGQS